MFNKLISFLTLVSLMFTVLEMTIDPSFYLGRIFLVISVIFSVMTALLFVKDNWQFALKPEKIQKNK